VQHSKIGHRCPLWVKSGHRSTSSQCPLWVKSGHRLSVSARPLSAKSGIIGLESLGRDIWQLTTWRNQLNSEEGPRFLIS